MNLVLGRATSTEMLKIHFSQICSVFLLCIFCVEENHGKNTVVTLKVWKLRLCMYCTGRCHAGTQKLCMNLRTLGCELPLPLPGYWLVANERWFSSESLLKHVRVLAVTVTGTTPNLSHTKFPKFNFLVIQENGQFHHL